MTSQGLSFSLLATQLVNETVRMYADLMAAVQESMDTAARHNETTQREAQRQQVMQIFLYHMFLSKAGRIAKSSHFQSSPALVPYKDAVL